MGRTTSNAQLSETARRMPMFEQERGEGTGRKKEEKLVVNLDLALYKAKVLGRKYEFEEAQKILEKVSSDRLLASLCGCNPLRAVIRTRFYDYVSLDITSVLN